MEKKTRARMGRPPIDPEKRRDVFITLRVTKVERALLEAEASKAGRTIADVLLRPWRKGD